LTSHHATVDVAISDSHKGDYSITRVLVSRMPYLHGQDLLLILELGSLLASLLPAVRAKRGSAGSIARGIGASSPLARKEVQF
jgi:hypothetical protein